MRNYERYYVDYGLLDEDFALMEEFTNKINKLKWGYSNHSLRRIANRGRGLSIKKLLSKTNGKLSTGFIFEFYKKKGKITKACYRIPVIKENKDITLVVTDDKTLVTFYFNKHGETHGIKDKKIYENWRCKNV